MIVCCGITDESVKYHYGNMNEQSEEELYFKHKNIRLIAARNDEAAFQAFIRSDEDFVLSVTGSTTFYPVMEEPNIRLAIEFDDGSDMSCVVCAEGLVEDDDRRCKADILLNDETVSVRKNISQPVWVEVKIPGDFYKDRIHGKVVLYRHSLFEDETKLDALDFCIDILDVRLPDPSEYRFHLNLWQHPSNIARKHEVTLWSEEHFAVLENYAKSLADLGEKVITIVVSEVPWSGQMCFNVKNYYSNLFEYNIIRVERNGSGAFHLDFSALDRYVVLCFKHGIDREIELIGLTNIWCCRERGFDKVAEDYPDAVRIRYYDKKDKQYRFMTSGDDIKSYIREIERHFIEKGWIGLVRVMADEPADEGKYEISINTILETAPRFQFKAAILHSSFIQRFRNKITDFVPIIGAVVKEWDTYKEMVAEKAGRYLWYTCCGAFPDTCIRAPLLESRFIGWLTAWLGLDGFLRWNYTVWPEKPRERISWNGPGFPAGETNFVYPGNDGRPLLTLRYKSLRRGIQDYELIRMLKEVHPDPGSVLERVYSMVIKAPDICKADLAGSGVKQGEIISLHYGDYEEAKRILLDEISKFTPVSRVNE